LIQPDIWVSEHPITELDGYLEKSTRLWNVALILEDAEEHEIAQERFQNATEGYKTAVGKDD
jgi:hypothetical protein